LYLFLKESKATLLKVWPFLFINLKILKIDKEEFYEEKLFTKSNIVFFASNDISVVLL
jgi:hypothetical protein